MSNRSVSSRLSHYSRLQTTTTRIGGHQARRGRHLFGAHFVEGIPKLLVITQRKRLSTAARVGTIERSYSLLVFTCSKLLAFHCLGKEVGFSAKKHVWYLSSLKALFVYPNMQYLPLLSPEVAIFTNKFFKERSSTARHIPWPHLLH